MSRLAIIALVLILGHTVFKAYANVSPTLAYYHTLSGGN